MKSSADIYFNSLKGDDGETTDEEILPPPTIRPQSSQNLDTKSPIRTPQKSHRPSSTTPGSSQRHRGPALASWAVDPAKPYAVIDKTGSNMIFYPAQRPQSRRLIANTSVNNSTATSPARASGSFVGDLGGRGVINQDILLRSPANLMMSGFAGHGGANIERLFGSHVVGPPEAFFPWTSIDSKGKVSHDDDNDNNDEDDDDYDDDDYDDDPEDSLDINDFIDFGDASDSNEEDDCFVDNSVVGCVCSFPYIQAIMN